MSTSAFQAACASALCALAALLPGGALAQPEAELAKIKLPPGFAISVYAHVPNARSLAVTPNSRVVIVTTRQDRLWAVVDDDGDYKGDGLVVLQDALNAASGVAYRDGYLYVAEQHRVRRAEFDENRPDRLLIWRLVRGRLLDNPHHGTRALAFGLDGQLYVALGVPCNICLPNSPDDAILGMGADGSNETIFATGIRNSVGMDIQPGTGQLWFTDNGVDTLGEDSPPDELNRVTKPGLFFGFPYFGGAKVRTPEFKDASVPREVTFPALELQPHSASLGIHFYRGNQFPAEYKHDLFIAQHGSWNRSVPIGYRIMRVKMDDKGNPTGQEVFAGGWLQPGGPWGRPNDIAELKDGSLLVSDDMAGVIYRISYGSR